MSVWQCSHPTPSLNGSGGELISVSVLVEPHELESFLDALAEVSFPVNPQIYHGDRTVVEFPAYSGDLPEIRAVLSASQFDPSTIRVRRMLEALTVC